MSKIIFAGVCIIEVALSNGKVFAFAGGTDFEERVAKDINLLKDERVKAIFVPSLPLFWKKNILRLSSCLDKEVQRSGISGERSSLLHKVFHDVSSMAAELNFSDCAVEIIPGDDLKLTFGFSNGRLLMLNLLGYIEWSANRQIFYSFFVKGELISSDVVEAKQFFEDFGEYLSM